MSYRNASDHPGYRAARIERAVAEAFEYSVLPVLEDPLLADLHVLRVEASANLATLSITLIPGDLVSGRDAGEVEAALERAQSWLRAELASTVAMKRVPVLKLRYVPFPITGLNGGR